MTSKKSSGAIWPFLVCGAVLTPYVILVVRGCEAPGHLEGQRALLAGGGFHSAGSGEAIGEYAAAVRLLRQRGWTRERLREYLDENAPLPAVDSLRVLEEASSLVIRGATKRSARIPRITFFRTTASVDSEPIDLLDLGLPAYATLIVARSRLNSRDSGGAARLSRAVFAMGLHLMTSDHHMLNIYGIACRQRAVQILRGIALEDGDSESVNTFDAILVALDEEFRVFKARKHDPGLRDIIDIMKD